MTPYEAAEVLALFDQADDHEGVFWRVDMDHGRDVKLFANCSDLFYWATADAEEITREDIPLLRQTLADLKAVDAAYNLNELFAARKRKLRPQRPCYRHFEAPVAALFDACCTEEERAEADRKDRDWWLAFAASQKREREQP